MLGSEPADAWECKGGFILDLFAIFLCLYAFYIVTDLRLVPAVNILCRRWSIPDDVAGATILGAALNSPELFTAVIGLVTGGDVGLGLLLGTFNFNILAIVGCTAIFARRKLRSRQLKVEWLYLQRDVYFYLVSILLLLWVTYDGEIEAWELGIMLTTYFLYCVVCACTGVIARHCCRPRRKRRRPQDFHVLISDPSGVKAEHFAVLSASKNRLPSFEDVRLAGRREHFANRRVSTLSASARMQSDPARSHGQNFDQPQPLPEAPGSPALCSLSSEEGLVAHRRPLLRDNMVSDAVEMLFPTSPEVAMAHEDDANTALNLAQEGDLVRLQRTRIASARAANKFRGYINPVTLTVDNSGAEYDLKCDDGKIVLPGSAPPLTSPLQGVDFTGSGSERSSQSPSGGYATPAEASLGSGGSLRETRARANTFDAGAIASVDMRLVSCAFDEWASAPMANDVLSKAVDVQLEQAANQVVVDHTELILSYPRKRSQVFFWAVTAPLKFVIALTIPSPREVIFTHRLATERLDSEGANSEIDGGVKRLGFPSAYYPISIVLSIVWLGIISFLLSQFSTRFGVAIGVPEEVIGLTVDCIGTSLPNVIAAVIAGQRGNVETAVCQAFGSNNFDILVAFALPYFAKALIDDAPIEVSSGSLISDGISNLVCLALLLAALFTSRMRLNRGVGYFCLVLYCLSLSLSVWFDLRPVV